VANIVQTSLNTTRRFLCSWILIQTCGALYCEIGWLDNCMVSNYWYSICL